MKILGWAGLSPKLFGLGWAGLQFLTPGWAGLESFKDFWAGLAEPKILMNNLDWGNTVRNLVGNL